MGDSLPERTKHKSLGQIDYLCFQGRDNYPANINVVPKNVNFVPKKVNTTRCHRETEYAMNKKQK